MGKHTRGEWVAVGYWVEHPDQNRPDICTCDPAAMGQEGRSSAEIMANARLIAAAPELYASLIVMVRHFGNGTRPTLEERNDAAYAIAKANGEAM